MDDYISVRMSGRALPVVLVKTRELLIVDGLFVHRLII